jgi:ECF transporter S component (folate family)
LFAVEPQLSACLAQQGDTKIIVGLGSPIPPGYWVICPCISVLAETLAYQRVFLYNTVVSFLDYKRFLEAQTMSKTKFSPLWMSYAGVLIALQIVLGNLVQIAFVEKQMNLGFLPIAVAGYLLGPVGGMLVAGLGDILGTLIFGTGAYFPGFTLTALLVGFLYGWMMYPRFHKWIARLVNSQYVELAIRAFLAASIAAVVYIFINSAWLMFFISKGYWLILISRLPFNLAEIPVFTVLITLTCVALNRLPVSLLPETFAGNRHAKSAKAEANGDKRA